MRFREREVAIAFDPRIALAMIVIDLVGVQSLQQALELIKAVPVMLAYCRTEHVRKFALVFAVAQRIQKRFALP